MSRFGSSDASFTGLSRNAKWALKQLGAAHTKGRGISASIGTSVAGNSGANLKVDVPDGMRRKLAQHFKKNPSAASDEVRQIFIKTNGFGTVTDANRHSLPDALHGSPSDIGFDPRGRGGGSASAGNSGGAANSQHRYDDIDDDNGKSHIQSQFDQWVVTAIVHYCPVSVQSVRVNELYTMLRRAVPDFTVETHCDGMPLPVLCSQCTYLQSHGGRLHFMRVIKPTGRHVSGSRENGTSTAFAVRRAEEELFTAEDDERDRVNRSSRGGKGRGGYPHSTAEDSHGGAPSSASASRPSATTTAGSPDDIFADATRHLDPDSIKRAMLRAHIAGRSPSAAIGVSRGTAAEASEAQSRRSETATGGVGISQRSIAKARLLQQQGIGLGNTTESAEQMRESEEAYEALDETEERMIAAALRGDAASQAALRSRYEDRRRNNFAEEFEEEEGGYEEERLSGRVDVNRRAQQQQSQLREEEGGGKEEEQRRGAEADEEEAEGDEYSEGVLAAEAIVRAYEQHVHRRLGDVAASAAIRNTHAARRSGGVLGPHANATATSGDRSTASLSLADAEPEQWGGDEDGFGPVTNLNIFDIHDDGSVMSLTPKHTTGTTSPSFYTSAGRGNNARREQTDEDANDGDGDVPYPLLYPTADKRRTDTMRSHAPGELPTAARRRSPKAASWRAPDVAANPSSPRSAAEAESLAMEQFYGQYVNGKDNNSEEGEVTSSGDNAIDQQQQQRPSALRQIREAGKVAREDDEEDAVDDINDDPIFGRFGTAFSDPNASLINHPNLTVEELYPHHYGQQQRAAAEGGNTNNSSRGGGGGGEEAHHAGGEATVQYKTVIDADGYESIVAVPSTGAASTVAAAGDSSSSLSPDAENSANANAADLDPKALAEEALRAQRSRALRERWEARRQAEAERRSAIAEAAEEAEEEAEEARRHLQRREWEEAMQRNASTSAPSTLRGGMGKQQSPMPDIDAEDDDEAFAAIEALIGADGPSAAAAVGLPPRRSAEGFIAKEEKEASNAIPRGGDAFEKALASAPDAAFDCLMMDGSGDVLGEGDAQKAEPQPSSFNDSSSASDAASSRERKGRGGSIRFDEPLIPSSGSTIPKNNISAASAANEAAHQQPSTKPRYVDTYFDNSFLRPESVPEPGTVSVTSPHLKAPSTEEFDYSERVVRSPSPYKNTSISDYYAQMRGEAPNRGEEEGEGYDNDASYASPSAYGSGTGDDNMYDDGRIGDDDEDAYLASDLAAEGDDANNSFGAHQQQPTVPPPQQPIGGSGTRRHRVSRSFDEGFPSSREPSGAASASGTSASASSQHHSGHGHSAAFDEEESRRDESSSSYYGNEEDSNNGRRRGGEKEEEKGHTTSSGYTKRHTYSEADADIYADPEAALLDGRAMTVGLSPYTFKQAKSRDGARKGPEMWRFPNKDTFKEGSFKSELRNRTLEKRAGRRSVF